MLDETPDATLDAVLGRLNDALERGDAAAAAALFQADSYWRDLVAFTWNIRTMEGQDADPRHARRASSPKIRPGSLAARPGRGGDARAATSPKAGSSSRPRPAAATATSG